MVGDSVLLLEDPRALPDQRSLHLLHSTICYAFVLLPRTRGGYNWGGVKVGLLTNISRGCRKRSLSFTDDYWFES